MNAEEPQTEEETTGESEENEEEAKEIEEGIEESLGEPEETQEEEKEKPELEKRRKEEEEVVEERIYTVPLARAWTVSRKKRSPKATRVLRSFIVRHMKVHEEFVRIDNDVNERVWSRGIQKPPRKIRIRATKDTEGIVTVRLAEGD
jgi:large subunit ribosomal protein L31e